MISKNNQQGDVNAGVVSRFDQGKAISSLRNGTNVNQIRGINVANATGSGIPKHVTNVNTSLANATTGSTTTVTVTFRRDPTDKTFSGVAVLVKGYQGNPSPVQLASGSDSPINFILNNTGEALSLTVQATGNGGAAPLGTAPTVGLSLPKSSSGGTGTTTTTGGPVLKTNGTTNGSQSLLNLKTGSNTAVSDDGSGGITFNTTIPNLPASQITSGQLALARGGTAVDLSASGSATAVLAQDGSHVISARALVAADIPSLDASKVTTGTLALARGGTNADLSATGGASQFLKQVSAGAAITVAQPTFSDLSGSATASQLPVLNAADQGYLFSNGSINPSVNLASAQVLVSNANETWAVQFVLPCALTLGKVSYKSGSVTVASTHASFGIYDAGGTLKCQGTFDTSVSASTDKTATFTRVTLVPGVYFFAWTTDNATINTTYTFTLANTTVIDELNISATAKRVGKGTASSGGVLNGTLGTITASALPNQSLPGVMFEYN